PKRGLAARGGPAGGTPPGRCYPGIAPGGMSGAFSMRSRIFAAVFAVAVGLLAVACGTSDDGGKVPSNSVAVVGDKAITKSEFDDLVNYAKRSYDAQKRPFPQVGTAEYAQIRDQAVRFLVHSAPL